MMGACALFSGATGCVDSGEVLFIIQNQVPTRGENGCVIPAARGTEFRGRGVVDTQGLFGYQVYPVAESRAEVVNGDSIARTVTVRGAEVSLEFQDDLFPPEALAEMKTNGLTEFTQRFSGSIDPTGGQATFTVNVLSPVLLQKLGGLVSGDTITYAIATIRIVGTMGGGNIKSDPFEFPIDICNGCLIHDLGACDALPVGFSAAKGGECNPFQDAPVDCCTAGGSKICPAVGTGTAP